ncbi:DUF1715-domain-containing protein [Nemania sp. FL0031]|nr:DUF1715-domain-containing protein [Nemania sp. FL0031]
MSSPPHDPFDDLLNLEEQYYREGYEEGLKDGAEAGRIEGYSLGLKKGFEKFVEAGRLQSKAMVWANRIPKYQERREQLQLQQKQQQQQQQQQDDISGSGQRAQKNPNKLAEGGDENKKEESDTSKNDARLPPIHSNPRLEKNIETLYGLVEPGTLSTNNDDEAVNDFDSRMKGANGKLRIIERAVGEGATGRHVTTLPSPPKKNDNIEDVGRIRSPVETRSVDR